MKCRTACQLLKTVSAMCSCVSHIRRSFLTAILAAGGLACLAGEAADGQRPNIIWIMAEDIGVELGCYGHPAVKTPHLDRFASEGVQYMQAFATAPSCTPSRNAMITGLYQTRTGTQDQRRRIPRPEGVYPITHYLKARGYYTALGCGYGEKVDLNFPPEKPFDGKDWSLRQPGQPFFAQIQLQKTHRQKPGVWEAIRQQSSHPVNPGEVRLPPYFPDTPECRMDWALYLDAIEYIDGQFGEIMERLKTEGLLDNTLVVFIGDNGRCHLRGKCWLYDAGIHVPLLVRYPALFKPGTANHDLVSLMDVTATMLELAGVDPMPPQDGFPLYGPRARKRDCIFAARDMIDEVMDHIRCVRTERFKYIRNYTPENGYNECRYVQNHRPMLAVMRALAAQGKLNEAQQLVLRTEKPPEELYDVVNDPHELNNLAANPEHQATLELLRKKLDGWIADTGDKGLEQRAAQ